MFATYQFCYIIIGLSLQISMKFFFFLEISRSLASYLPYFVTKEALLLFSFPLNKSYSTFYKIEQYIKKVCISTNYFKNSKYKIADNFSIGSLTFAKRILNWYRNRELNVQESESALYAMKLEIYPSLSKNKNLLLGYF